MSTPTEAVTRAAPVLEANPADLRLLLRWLGAMLLIALALAGCVWTRMAVRSTALELDAARSSLARAEAQHERLEVERSLLRAPGRLQAKADTLALVAPAAIITLTPEGATP